MAAAAERRPGEDATDELDGVDEGNESVGRADQNDAYVNAAVAMLSGVSAVGELRTQVDGVVSATGDAAGELSGWCSAATARTGDAGVAARAGDTDEALRLLSENDAASADAARTCGRLVAQADALEGRARAGLETVQAERVRCEACVRELVERSDAVEVRRHRAWEMHAGAAESLEASNQHYAAADRASRRVQAWARATGWFGALDDGLQERLGVPVLAPLSAIATGTARAASRTAADRHALLALKRDLRALYADARAELAWCAREEREVSARLADERRRIDSLRAQASELRRVALAAMRVAAFWKERRADALRISSHAVARHLNLTRRVQGGSGAGGGGHTALQLRLRVHAADWATLATPCEAVRKAVRGEGGDT